MKDLMIKEFSLARHPTIFIFPFLGAMLLIPDYPYFVAFIYTCLSVFFIFLLGRENKDILFTVSLPVRKRDTVKARCWMIVIIELFQVAFSIPFAILGNRIKPTAAGNSAGIEANVAFFGLVFLMFALFNSIFLPVFYKTAFRAGWALTWAGLAITVYILVVEAAIQIVPALKSALDTVDPYAQIRQLPILLAGMLIFAMSMFLSYRRAAARFEKVNL